MKKRAPVFIVGCPRSGTTLLGAMLGSHPDCICLPESQFISELMPDGEPSAPVDPDALFAAIERHFRFRIWQFDFKGARPPCDSSTTFADTIHWLVDQYAARTGKPSTTVWVDQTPHNLLYGERLARHFPNVKFIHLIRDGRAVAASVLPLRWGPNDIREAALDWTRKLAFGLSLEARFGPDRTISVRYEDVVRDGEATMRRIARFVGVDYSPALLETGGLRLPDYTRKQHRLIGAKPDGGRTDAWKSSLTPRQIEIFESLTADLLAYHGYALTAGLRPNPLSWHEKVLIGQKWLVGRLTNEIAFRRQLSAYSCASQSTGERDGARKVSPA